MNELELLKKSWEEQHMYVYTLEENNGYKLIMTKHKYENNNYYFYTNPMYQIFNSNGKRLYVTSDEYEARSIFSNERTISI